MMNDFEGKAAIVTGAASGMGKATALGFARRGAAVTVADIDRTEAEKTVGAIEAEGGRALAIEVDVSNAAQVESMVTATVERFGRLDCAFNNAGIVGERTTLTECTEENWDKVIAVNLKGVWLCLKYELLVMLKQGHGAIVNMSSVAGLVGYYEIPPYAPSKHGVVGLTKTAALEYATQGIRVNAMCPGEIQTPMMEEYTLNSPELEEQVIAVEPMGRLGSADEVAEAVIWLCSDAASFVTGHTMVVDGGYIAR